METTVSPKQFVEAWQTSNSVAEVATKTGMSKPQVRVRACRYRQHGIPLKEFPPVPLPSVDWEGLSRYATELGAIDLPMGNPERDPIQASATKNPA